MVNLYPPISETTLISPGNLAGVVSVGQDHEPGATSPAVIGQPRAPEPPAVSDGELRAPSIGGAESAGKSCDGLPATRESHIDHPAEDFPCLDSDAADAQAKANDCEEFVRLTAENLSGNQAAVRIGRSPAWFSIHLPRWRREGRAAFLPRRRELGAGRRLFTDLPDWFIPACKFFWLITNQNRCGGSVPDAILRAVSLPVVAPAVKQRLQNHLGLGCVPGCPAQLREDILVRHKSGKPLLPESLARLIPANKTVVTQYRAPKNTRLDYLHAPGSAMWLWGANGEKIFIRPGMVVEPDDATINIPAVVPWDIGGCPCSERFKVKLARFQWLVAVDAGSRKVLAWSYTARPKSSYRAEDIVSLQKAVVLGAGIPEFWRMEQGAWASKLVGNAVKNMGSKPWPVFSPRSKPFIEGLFNKLWTKLSVWFPDSDVGRFRGETEAANKLLTACQQGHRDPRKYFPPLQAMLQAIGEVIAAHNASIIRSKNYGEWIPNERWDRAQAESPMRQLEPGNEWLFSPMVQTWTIQGGMIGGQVRIMDGVSVPFQFSAPNLMQFHGAKARVYFDPNEPRCVGKVALAQPWGNHRAGELIADAVQINETTQYIRMVMGYGDEPRDAGRRAMLASARALRREVRGIAGRKAPNPYGYSESEARDGLGRVTKISTATAAVEATSQECAGRNRSHIPVHAVEGSSAVRDNPGGSNGAASSHDDAASVLERERPELFI